MVAVNRQPTFFLSGFVYANEWNKFGAVTSLAILADNNTEYRIFPDKNSIKLNDYRWDYLEIEYTLLSHLRMGPWIKVLNFTNKNEPLKDLNTQSVFDSKESVDEFAFEIDFKNLTTHKKFDESEWSYQKDYYSLPLKAVN